ncbi:nuclear pore complex protein DDB_G0274915-like isoform X2 [Euwallacea fornicatus]|uniref:nuclear pore complex protein DDB_G0274915-like isoform X2 n=1 Tax=Euwallacea fornicatus TaxID=995702 RepID=UPI00338E7C6C
MMKQVLLALALIAYVECAKLDHLTYLPPDNRPKNTGNYDQGLTAPIGQASSPQQTSFGPFSRAPEETQPALRNNYIEPASDNHQRPAEFRYSGQAPQGAPGGPSTGPSYQSPQGHAGTSGGSAPLSRPQYANQPQRSYSQSGPSVAGLQQGPSANQQIPILKLNSQNDGAGTYHTEYETGNGIQSVENGEDKGESKLVQGSFSYTSPEGEKIGLSYTADEEGFHPQGDNLPTPPPVPEAILKSIEYNKAHPEDEGDDGLYNEDEESKQHLALKNNSYSRGQPGGFPSNGGHGTFSSSSGSCSGLGASCSKGGGNQPFQSSGPSFQGAVQPSGSYRSSSVSFGPSSQGTSSNEATNFYRPPSNGQEDDSSYPCKTGGPSCGAFGPSSQAPGANQPSQLSGSSSQRPNQPGSGAFGSTSQGTASSQATNSYKPPSGSFSPSSQRDSSSYPCKTGEPSCGAFGPSPPEPAASQSFLSYRPSSNTFGPSSKPGALGSSTQGNGSKQSSQPHGVSGSTSRGTTSSQSFQSYEPSNGFGPSSYTPGASQKSPACAGSASGCRPSYGQSKPNAFEPSPQGNQFYRPSSGPSSSTPVPSHPSRSEPQQSIPSVFGPSSQTTGPNHRAQSFGPISDTFGSLSQVAEPSSTAFGQSSHTSGAGQPSQRPNGGCAGFSGCGNGAQSSPQKGSPSQSYGPSSGELGPSSGPPSPTQRGLSGQALESLASQFSSTIYRGGQAASKESGYQYKSPTLQFGVSSSPQGPSNASGKKEFGTDFAGSFVKPSRVPPVQAQDKNGGYLY